MNETLNVELETRRADRESRTVVGVCVPYNETSYLVPGPSGERIRKGAFSKSIRERGVGAVFLNVNHDEERTIGKAVSLDDRDEGLVGEFKLNRSPLADGVLDEIEEGYWPFMSIGFRPIPNRSQRGDDGAVEVAEAVLGHVALVKTGAYTGARTLSVRDGEFADPVAWARAPHPTPDLSPYPNWRRTLVL